MGHRVLMYGWEFPPAINGGLGVACRGLSFALANKHVDITFVLPKAVELPEGPVSFKFANEGRVIKMHTVQSEITTPYLPQVHSFQTAQEQRFYRDTFYAKLIDRVLAYEEHAAEVALNEDFDIIHAHDWLTFGAGLAAKKATGKPLVAQIHATEFDRGGGQGVNEFIYQKEYEGLHSADRIIAVSEYTKGIVVEKYGINPDKIDVVYNGVDVEEAKHDDISKTDLLKELKDAGYNIVLSLGRLTLQKNPENMLHAAKKVIEHHPKTFFVFAGAGDMKERMLHLTAELGISNKVIFPGWVNSHEKHKLFRVADMFIMPSISEPFGIVSLEALINSTPVLVSKQSGIAETLHSALKVDFWDVDEIVNQIVSLLRHSAIRETLIKNGHSEVPKFSWANSADACLEVYNKVGG